MSSNTQLNTLVLSTSIPLSLERKGIGMGVFLSLGKKYAPALKSLAISHLKGS